MGQGQPEHLAVEPEGPIEVVDDEHRVVERTELHCEEPRGPVGHARRGVRGGGRSVDVGC